jgi:hypothetical protein
VQACPRRRSARPHQNDSHREPPQPCHAVLQVVLQAIDLHVRNDANNVLRFGYRKVGGDCSLPCRAAGGGGAESCCWCPACSAAKAQPGGTPKACTTPSSGTTTALWTCCKTQDGGCCRWGGERLCGRNAPRLTCSPKCPARPQHAGHRSCRQQAQSVYRYSRDRASMPPNANPPPPPLSGPARAVPCFPCARSVWVMS